MTTAYNMLKVDKQGKVSHTIPDSVIDNLTARMKTIATRVDGSLSPEDKGAIYQHSVFSMVGLHRGWLFEGLSRRLKSKGYETTLPYIEIYGHWTNDETKLETELLMSLK